MTDMLPMQRLMNRIRQRSIGVTTMAAFGLAFTSVSSVGAQEREPPVREMGVLKGQVIAAESDASLQGADIFVERASDGRTWRTKAGGGGRFRIPGLGAGEYTLRLSLLGWRERTERLLMEPGRERDLLFELSPNPIPVEAVQVLLNRTRLVTPGSDLPGSAQSLGGEELGRLNSLYGDVHKAVLDLPGVNVQEEEGYGLRPNIGLRGTGSERSSKITLMEDGVLIAPAPYAAPAAYYFPLIGRMEAVEVRKGSSQIKYGPRTIGGALNLVSRSIPNRLEASAAIAGGQNGTGRFSGTLGDSYSNLGWLAQANLIRTDGFKRLDGGGGLLEPDFR
jgi:Fe(3+) dicitrate transport protein